MQEIWAVWLWQHAKVDTWIYQSCCCLLHPQKLQLYLCVFHCMTAPASEYLRAVYLSFFVLSCRPVHHLRNMSITSGPTLIHQNLITGNGLPSTVWRSCIWISARSLSLFSWAFLNTSTSPHRHEHNFRTNVDTSKFDYGQWIAFHEMTALASQCQHATCRTSLGLSCTLEHQFKTVLMHQDLFLVIDCIAFHWMRAPACECQHTTYPVSLVLCCRPQQNLQWLCLAVWPTRRLTQATGESRWKCSNAVDQTAFQTQNSTQSNDGHSTKVIFWYKDTWYKDILVVRRMQLGTKHCILTAVMQSEEGQLDIRTIFLVFDAVVIPRDTSVVPLWVVLCT